MRRTHVTALALLALAAAGAAALPVFGARTAPPSTSRVKTVRRVGGWCVCVEQGHSRPADAGIGGGKGGERREAAAAKAQREGRTPPARWRAPLSLTHPPTLPTQALHKATNGALFPTPASLRAARKAAIRAEIKEENDWKTDLVLGALLPSLRARLPRVVVAWARNYLACMAIYFGLGGERREREGFGGGRVATNKKTEPSSSPHHHTLTAAWCYYIYYVFGSTLFKPGTIPPRSAVFEQIRVASVAMPLYAVLPSIVEAAAEAGYTAAVSRVSDLGGIGGYFASFIAYMTWVEFGVYWMHRGLHDVKAGYRLLHHTHHKYNKEHTLSPFAGLAFNAIDGILQALPYAVGLLFIPMHFFTHELLLFLTAIWTASIHDCLDAGLTPIMGAGYHTIHHTTYRHNYGHYFTYMDGLFGSLVTPDEYARGEGKGKA